MDDTLGHFAFRLKEEEEDDDEGEEEGGSVVGLL